MIYFTIDSFSFYLPFIMSIYENGMPSMQLKKFKSFGSKPEKFCTTVTETGAFIVEIERSRFLL